MRVESVVFIGHNALGDLLCTTPVIRAFRHANPNVRIVYVVQNANFCRILDGNPDIDLLLYNEQMYLHGLSQFSQEWLHSLPLDIRKQGMLYNFDIRQVCTSWEAYQQHISQGFSKLLNIPIDSTRPVVVVQDKDRRTAKMFTSRPYVLLSMHSISNPPRSNENGGLKNWPKEYWATLAKEFYQRGLNIIAVGAEKDEQFPFSHVKNLYGLPIKIVAALIEQCAGFITIENGLAHLAAALDVPTVQLYAPIVPQAWAYPAEATRWRTIYEDPLTVTPQRVLKTFQEIFEFQKVGT